MLEENDGQRLTRAINNLGIKKAHFALLAGRTSVMVSFYCNNKKPIPEWIWLVVDKAKKLSKRNILKKKINALRKSRG